MFIISDLLSLVPSSDKGTAPPPVIGSSAPKDSKNRLHFPLEPARPLFLLFPRHVGCPFAEKQVHQLVALVLSNPSRFSVPSSSSSSDDVERTTITTVPVTFLIVTHSDLTSSRSWFASVLNDAVLAFTTSSRSTTTSSSSPPPDSSLIAQHFSLFPDPSGTLSSAYGIGSLPSYSSLFSKTMWAEIAKLKEEGIVNRTTGGGSDRWKSQGAVVIGSDGLVKWWWKGEKAEEEGDWEEGLRSLGI
ncbi:hypothetical protein BDY24DRAFT_416744 [Mrakia frigida]|uniref:uncharacterized protein n=1 Tax=Mrakia frigida TaxID=29902 RepID=UPI003FCC110A